MKKFLYIVAVALVTIVGFSACEGFEIDLPFPPSQGTDDGKEEEKEEEKEEGKEDEI